MMYSKATTIAAAVLLGIVLVGVFVLAWHGTITGGDAIGIVGGIVTALLAIFGVHSGVQAGSNAAQKGPVS